MASIQDLINLAKADGGKFFVLDETGEAKLVILPLAEYQKLLLGKLQRQVNEVENIKSEVERFIRDERNKYSNESARLHELFEQDMVDEFNLLQFPFSIIRKIHDVAWEKGHSGGYAEVYNCYFDIVEFAEFIMKHAKDI